MKLFFQNKVSILKSQFSSRTGFTLIELLVVISIISVLAALLMANFIGVRQRGRDAQRKSNLYQIQSALEIYRSDNGNYPNPSLAPSPGCGKGVSISNGTTTYMNSIPCDPLTGNAFKYTSTDGTTYSIVACLENEKDQDKDGTTDSSCTAGSTVFPASFTLTNP